jgi:excisionase family DNA binding protein
MSISSVGNGDSDGPILRSPNEAMFMLGVGRAKLYELLNRGELESFREGRSRKITAQSLRAYVQRKLQAEAQRGRVA